MIQVSIEKKLETAVGQQVVAVDFQLNKGDCCAIYGVSGVGKTTLLRIIAGLTTPDKGKITVDGTVWVDTINAVVWSPQQRGVGMVFQDYALFPNMTIEQQLRFANPTDHNLLEELLQTMEITALRNRKPQQLSGGQQQRVALARALMQKPTLLLLDEPLSALDERLNKQMCSLLKWVQQTYRTTILMVSHNVEEIATLANKMLVINHSRAILYDNPKAFFEQEGLLQKIEMQAVVLSKDEKTHCIMVKLRHKIERVQLDIDAWNQIQIGDSVIVESMVRPSDYKLKL